MECTAITIDVQSNELNVDATFAVVGGILGLIVGALIGIFVMKFFLMEILRKCFEKRSQTHSQVNAVNTEPIAASEKLQVLSYELEVENTDEHEIGDNSEIDASESIQFNEGQEGVSVDVGYKGLADVVVSSTLDSKLIELSKQESNALACCSVVAWKHRHMCILQTFRVVLTQYYMNQQLSAEDYTQILEKVEKGLDCSLQQYHQSRNKAFASDSSECILPSIQSSKLLWGDLRQVWMTYEEDLTVCVGLEHAAVIHAAIVRAMMTWELKIKDLLRCECQELVHLYHRSILVVQAYHSAHLARVESLRWRRSYVETILHRLTTTKRLGKELGGQMWNGFRDELESGFDQIDSETQEAVKLMLADFSNQRKQLFLQLGSERNRAVQKILDQKSSSSKINQFIERYFEVVFRFRKSELSALHQATNTEATMLAQLTKKSKLSLHAKCEEALENLCNSLAENRALSPEEAQQMLEELRIKVEKADDKSSRMNQVQTRVLDHEANACRSLTTDDDVSSHGARSRIVQRARSDLCRCLDTQCLLSESDRKSVTDDYDVTALLFDSQAYVTRVMTYRSLDVELLSRQLRTMELAREEQHFETDEDIETTVEKVNQLKADHIRKCNSQYRQANTGVLLALIESQFPHLFALMAKTLLSKMTSEEKLFCKSERAMNSVKRIVIDHINNLGKLDDRTRAVLCDEHNANSRDLENQLRHEHDMQVQLLKDRLSANQQVKLTKLYNRDADLMKVRPQTASQFSIANVLDRFFEHIRNQRKVEATECEADVEMTNHVFLQRLAFQRKLSVALQDLDKTFLCKLAIGSEMKKAAFLQLVRDGLELASLTRNGVKTWSNDFGRCWSKVKGKPSKRSDTYADGSSYDVVAPARLPPIATQRKKGRSFLSRRVQSQALA